jgi:hypothetical protein
MMISSANPELDVDAQSEWTFVDELEHDAV